MAWYLPLYLNTRTWSFSSPGRSISSTGSMAPFVLGILKALHLGTIRLSSSMLGNSDARPTKCQAAVPRVKGFICCSVRGLISVGVGRNLQGTCTSAPPIPVGSFTTITDIQHNIYDIRVESVRTFKAVLQVTLVIFHMIQG